MGCQSGVSKGKSWAGSWVRHVPVYEEDFPWLLILKGGRLIRGVMASFYKGAVIKWQETVDRGDSKFAKQSEFMNHEQHFPVPWGL